jgi:hypothetical protein
MPHVRVVARQLFEHGRVLRLVRQVHGDSELLLTRCAWCRRYALKGAWVEIGERPRFLLRRIARRSTHGLCPRCLDEVRERDLSL